MRTLSVISASRRSWQGRPTATDKLIHDGQVDADALVALEQRGNARVTAAGYFITGKFEMERQNFSKARSFFEAALRFESQSRLS